MHRRVFGVMLALLLVAAGVACGGERARYRMETRVFLISDSAIGSFSGQEVSVQGDARAGDDVKKARRVIALSAPARMYRGDKEDGTPVLSMEKDRFEVQTSKEREGDIQEISHPQIVVLDGKEGCMEISSGPPQYFEVQPGGAYTLKTLPAEDWIGFEMRLLIRGDKKNAGMKFEYRTVGARAKLEGVGLDVGKPEIEKSAVDLDPFPFANNEWTAILTPEKNGKRLLIGVKIESVAAKP